MTYVQRLLKFAQTLAFDLVSFGSVAGTFAAIDLVVSKLAVSSVLSE